MSEFPLRPRPSGVELLFTPTDPPSAPSVIVVDDLLAQCRADAHQRGLTEAGQAATARIAALEQAHANALAARDAAHAEALVNAEQTHAAALVALDSAFADALLPLALDIARAILSAPPPADTIVALVNEILSTFPEDQGGTLFGPPGPPPPLPPGWTWREDPDLTPGTVRAEVQATRVTASVAARLDQLVHELLA